MNQHEPGDVLARRYVLLERIAAGGTSVLWRARDRSLDRLVAVKVLQDQRELARKEARTTARLTHPDAIEVYDYGETVTAQGRVAAFVVLRLLDGEPLAERLTRGPLPWTEAAGTAARIARVLEAAHAEGIVHRDVSAENVLLTEGGPKLLDFGIAALAGDPDDERGTPPYVAPERLTGAPAHPAVDVYALGVLFFQMLTGVTPYPETTWEQLETARRAGPCPRPPGVPGDLAVLCQRCLDPAPSRRPSAREVADQLGQTLGRARLRHRVRHGLALMALGTVAATMLWAGPSGDQGRPAGPAALPEPRRTAAELPSSAPLASPAPLLSSTPLASPAPLASSTPFASPAPLASSTPRNTLAASAVPEVLDRFRVQLAEAARAQRIRSDVALDLRQTLANGTTPQGVADLRRKLDDRLREGAVELRLHGELDALLAELAVVVRS